MNKSEKIGELTKALSKAQGEFEHASKDTKNEFFKSRYATLASVIDAAKKPLSDNGLSVTQLTETDESGRVYLITLLSHSSGEWISGKYPIDPVKKDPQGFGSAYTYARRYNYSAITGIAADDDDGNEASQRGKSEQRPKAPPGTFSRKIPEPKPEDNPEMVTEDGEVVTLDSPSNTAFDDYITDEQLMTLNEYIQEMRIPISTQKAWLDRAAISKITDLPRDKADLLIKSLKEKSNG